MHLSKCHSVGDLMLRLIFVVDTTEVRVAHVLGITQDILWVEPVLSRG